MGTGADYATAPLKINNWGTQLGHRKHRNHSANLIQSDTARRLRAEKVQLEVRFRDDKTEAEESLKKRMLEFLVDVPGWMMSGL